MNPEPRAAERPEPPFGPPDCPWVEVSSGKSVPENAVSVDGKLNGDTIYIGRVYDGGYYLIGTVIPSKNVCLYLSQDLEVKSSTSYEILTTDCGNPLEFQKMQFDSDLIFVAGGSVDKDEILYVGRFKDGENTYLGWADNSTKAVYIPRDVKLGPQKIEKDYDVLIHLYLDRLCICPPCPTPPY